MTESAKSTSARPASANAPKEAHPSLKDKLRALRDHLLTDLIERDTPLRLALLAALAGEHLLLLGPPGTAKSELARRLRYAFRDANYFERLLTRFTVPEELFGPLSIKGLEEDRYQRQIAGYLPNASIAFLDEIFKANSAILNSLLTLLNEREFDNGTQRIHTPLICVIGASNELPESEEMDALYDRFLLRCHVPRVSDAGFERLMQLRGQFRPAPPLDLLLSPKDLTEIRQNAQRVSVPGDVFELLKAMRQFCISQSIDVSERRWRKTLFMLQVAAYSEGRNEVSQWDCWLLQHCLWAKPEEQVAIFEWYKGRVGAVAAAPDRFTKLVATWEKTLTTERESQTQVCDKDGRPLYYGASNKPVLSNEGKRQRTNSKGEPLFLLPKQFQNRTNNGAGYTQNECIDTLREYYGYHYERTADMKTYFSDQENWLMEPHKLPPVLQPTKYSNAHVRGRCDQVKEIANALDSHLGGLKKQVETVNRDISDSLWIAAAFATDAGATLEEQRKQHQEYARRLAAVLKGFEALPRSET